MKRTITAVLTAVALSSTMPAVQAASQDECAIWICLPFGFLPDDCSKAQKAMFKRLSEFKGPIPGWSSCSTNEQPDRLVMLESHSALMNDGGILLDVPCVEPVINCSKTLDTYRIFNQTSQQFIGDIYHYDFTGFDYLQDADTLEIERILPPDVN